MYPYEHVYYISEELLIQREREKERKRKRKRERERERKRERERERKREREREREREKSLENAVNLCTLTSMLITYTKNS